MVTFNAPLNLFLSNYNLFLTGATLYILFTTMGQNRPLTCQ